MVLRAGGAGLLTAAGDLNFRFACGGNNGSRKTCIEEEPE